VIGCPTPRSLEIELLVKQWQHDRSGRAAALLHTTTTEVSVAAFCVAKRRAKPVARSFAARRRPGVSCTLQDGRPPVPPVQSRCHGLSEVENLNRKGLGTNHLVSCLRSAINNSMVS
jgi:hypothetical protein